MGKWSGRLGWQISTGLVWAAGTVLVEWHYGQVRLCFPLLLVALCLYTFAGMLADVAVSFTGGKRLTNWNSLWYALGRAVCVIVVMSGVVCVLGVKW